MSFWKRTLLAESEGNKETTLPTGDKSPPRQQKEEPPVSPLAPPPTSPSKWTPSPVPAGRPHPILSPKKSQVTPPVSPMPNVFNPALSKSKVPESPEQGANQTTKYTVQAPELSLCDGHDDDNRATKEEKPFALSDEQDKSFDDDREEEEESPTPSLASGQGDGWDDEEDLDDVLDDEPDVVKEEEKAVASEEEPDVSHVFSEEDSLVKNEETKEIRSSTDEIGYYSVEWTPSLEEEANTDAARTEMLTSGDAVTPEAPGQPVDLDVVLKKDKDEIMPPLPHGWVELIDPSSGDPYYLNERENLTVQERPVAERVAEEQLISHDVDMSLFKAQHDVADGFVASEDASPEHDAFHDATEVLKTSKDSGGSDPTHGIESEHVSAKIEPNMSVGEDDVSLTDAGKANKDQLTAADTAADGNEWSDFEQSDEEISLEAANEATAEGDEEPRKTPSFDEGNLPPLPLGWVQMIDESSGDTYYLNETDNVTSWERPISVVSGADLSKEASPVDKTEEASVSVEDDSANGNDENVGDGGWSGFEETDDVSTGESHHLSGGGDVVPIEGPDITKEIFSGEETLLALPPGWVQMTDPSSGDPYYLNESDIVTTWDRPLPERDTAIDGAEEGPGNAENLPNPDEQAAVAGEQAVVADVDGWNDFEGSDEYSAEGELDNNEAPIDSDEDEREGSQDEVASQQLSPVSASIDDSSGLSRGSEMDGCELLGLAEAKDEPSIEEEKASLEDVTRDADDDGWSDFEEPGTDSPTEDTERLRASDGEESLEGDQEDANVNSEEEGSLTKPGDLPAAKEQMAVGDAKAGSAVEELWRGYAEPDRVASTEGSETAEDCVDERRVDLFDLGEGSATEVEALSQLPPGWVQLIDPSSGNPYYYNEADSSTTWELPVARLGAESESVQDTEEGPISGEEAITDEFVHETDEGQSDNLTSWERPPVAKKEDDKDRDHEPPPSETDDGSMPTEEEANGATGGADEEEWSDFEEFDGEPSTEPIEIAGEGAVTSGERPSVAEKEDDKDRDQDPPPSETDDGSKSAEEEANGTTGGADEEEWSDFEEFDGEPSTEPIEIAGEGATTSGEMPSLDAKSSGGEAATSKGSVPSDPENAAKASGKLSLLTFEEIEKDAAARVAWPDSPYSDIFSPRFQFLSSVPAELEKLQEQSARRRHEFHIQIHELECRLASITSRLAHASMDWDLVSKDWMDVAVMQPLEEVADRVFLKVEKQLAARPPPSLEPPPTPCLADLERRMIKVDTNLTRHVHVTMHDARSNCLEALSPVVQHDLAPCIKLEHSKAAKREGTIVRRFESIAGNMSRQIHEAQADRRVSLELMQQRLGDAVESDDEEMGEEFIELLQDLRRRLHEERLQRKKHDRLVLEKIVQTTAAMKRALLETVGDPS